MPRSLKPPTTAAGNARSTDAPSVSWCGGHDLPIPPKPACSRSGGTNRCDLTTIEADRFYRNYAIVELAIRELKDGGDAHIPSGRYPANAAWFACAVLAHNLGRWTVILGKQDPLNSRTLRVRIIAVPAVAVNKSGRHTLRLPTRWPWRDDFTTMLTNLRALPGPGD